MTSSKPTALSSTTTSSSSSTTTTKNAIALIGVTCNPQYDASPILREGISDLFQLYFDELYTLGCDLGFQGFQNEWIDLPGKYDFKNRGGIYVAVELPLPAQVEEEEVDKDNENIMIIQPTYNGRNDDNSESNSTTTTAATDSSMYNIDLKSLLTDKNQVVGCIAIRTLTPTCGELKRMYIRTSHRRLGIGKLLAKCIIDYGFSSSSRASASASASASTDEELGRCSGMYEELKLDSLERLKGAVKLYENLGFQRIDPYCECPEDDHICMNLFKE